MHLAEKVEFCGPIGGDQVPEVVTDFDVFVNLLAKGGAGKAVLEAMSMKVPTLICTTAFDPFLTKEDRDVLVFRPDDPESLKHKIVGVMNSCEEDRSRMGERLRELVVRQHSLGNLAGKIKAIFQNLQKNMGR